MDDEPAFTKMTGLMDLNDIAHKVKLYHPPNRGSGEKLICKLSVPCHLGESWKKSQCKINFTNKKSAKAGIQEKHALLDPGFRRGDSVDQPDFH
jgi:hypothetical protein